MQKPTIALTGVIANVVLRIDGEWLFAKRRI